LSRFKLVGSNVLTALVTVVVTSAFWLIAFNNDGPGDGRVEASGDSVTLGRRNVEVVEGLVVGPAGLAIPVAGIEAGGLQDTFTQARAGGARVHDAIDIMAPHGTRVVAAAPGTVEKLFFSKGGGGISAYVRSNDRQWNYYYAHLQDYAPGLVEGQRVVRGQLIGTVGSTGNANPAGPHLHFAINRMARGEKWYDGAPVNPYPLLAGKGAAR